MFTPQIDVTSPAVLGLSSQAAEARLEHFGSNEPATTERGAALSDLLHVFLNPLVLILLIAAIASAFLGQAVDAAIISAIVALSGALNFAQTYRSERAIKRLRGSIAPTATVIRDGKVKEIPRRDVVPGDMVLLSAGDLVPADGRLIVARDLYVQQAALTGESFPAEKEATPEPASTKADARNMVFLGTSVVSGTATAEVVATGARTAFGDVAARLAARPEETAFDQGLRKFSLLLARTVFFLVIFLIAVSVALHRDPFESLLFAVALAVGLTPEFLPMITAVTLSKGAVAMADKKVIVKGPRLRPMTHHAVLNDEESPTPRSVYPYLHHICDNWMVKVSAGEFVGDQVTYEDCGVQASSDSQTCVGKYPPIERLGEAYSV